MRFAAFPLTGLLLAGVSVAAQTPSAQRPGTVRIVVHDLTDLPILGADVTLTAADAGTVKATTDVRGEARFEGVRPGVYSARVTATGFNPFEIREVMIPAGGHVARDITLQVAGVFEAVDVAPGADDRRLMNAFTRQLTPDQLEALPEDPEELARVLAQLVGVDADIRVDGFKVGRLPLGTRIQEIRIRDDVGAASSGGGPRVEIVTTRGGERWRNNAGMTMRDASLNARNAFSGLRPTGQTRQYSWNLNGPLVRNRTGLSVSVDGSTSIENQTIRAAMVDGIFSRVMEQPSNGIGVWIGLDHQITPAQTIRMEFTRRANEGRNQGIGEFDLPERAFTSISDNGQFQLNHRATVGRRYVNDLRFAFEWDSERVSPLTEARAIRVLDAFTSGGAQQKGLQRSRSIDIENEFELTLREQHHITTGVSVDGASYRGEEYSNASGTYTFSSLASYEAGQPATFTQRVGDPTFSYSLYRFGWYVQDDYRVRRNVMINLGLRHDFQTHMRDWANLSPRLGVSWTPSSNARTTLRASAGILHSQMSAGIYQQLLLVDGAAQRDLVISDPGYPDPFSAGVTEATTLPSIIRARSDLAMPFSYRYTVGVDQPVGKFSRVRGTFVRENGRNLFRSRNANEPVNGVRPDPTVLTVTELQATARSLTESFKTEVMVSYPPRRLSANLSYVIGTAMNETDSPFSLPPDSVLLAREWGPSRGDARHTLNVGLNSDLAGGFRLAANFRAQSALPYNITLGADSNGDGVLNERPEGVTRNSARGAPTTNLDLALTWRLSLGERGVEGSQRERDRRRSAGRDSAPFRFEVFARATNVLNVVNPLNFSGVLTSPFFGLPTSAAVARRVAVGTRVWF
ncbi:MAG TPA: carboxypeptidase regulatory-like domain-containing protein [Vicinamibacterales bacterium]|nr:carboxypeptidase regulatory-like domain-containing protein [Vicinamibacterales bacterium]